MIWKLKLLPFSFEKIYLDENARKDPVSEALLKVLPDVPVETIQDKRSLIKHFSSMSDPIGIGKKHLFVTRFYGRRLKPCPGTSNHICCGYYVINAITNCPMDCSYCVLQGYLNNPLLTVYTNWDDLIEEINGFLSTDQTCVLRLGTGELSDSLALDSVFPISSFLVEFFSRRQRSILELKTKSANVNSILDLDHRGKTVISWSISPPGRIEKEEMRTAPWKERLEAAKRCQEKGYPLGLHFDPILHYEGWEKEYQKMIFEWFRQIDPKRVIWISLGGFRYPPKLKAIAEQRFPRTEIFLGELFPGRDGKFRYLKEIRVDMYRKMAGWLKEIDPGLFVYLCMESKEVWEKVFGRSPSNSFHLNQLFEKRVKEFL